MQKNLAGEAFRSGVLVPAHAGGTDLVTCTAWPIVVGSLFLSQFA